MMHKNSKLYNPKVAFRSQDVYFIEPGSILCTLPECLVFSLRTFPGDPFHFVFHLAPGLCAEIACQLHASWDHWQILIGRGPERKLFP
jgi:hypothetical protein